MVPELIVTVGSGPGTLMPEATLLPPGIAAGTLPHSSFHSDVEGRDRGIQLSLPSQKEETAQAHRHDGKGRTSPVTHACWEGL